MNIVNNNLYPQLVTLHELNPHALIVRGNEHFRQYIWTRERLAQQEPVLEKISFIAKSLFWLGAKIVLSVPCFFIDLYTVGRIRYNRLNVRNTSYFGKTFVSGAAALVVAGSVVILTKLRTSTRTLIKEFIRTLSVHTLTHFAGDATYRTLSVWRTFLRGSAVGTVKIIMGFTNFGLMLCTMMLVILIGVALLNKIPFLLFHEPRNSGDRDNGQTQTPLTRHSYSINGKNREIFNRRDFPTDHSIPRFFTRMTEIEIQDRVRFVEGQALLRQGWALRERIGHLDAKLEREQAPPVTLLDRILSLNWTGFSMQRRVEIGQELGRQMSDLKVRMRCFISIRPVEMSVEYWRQLDTIAGKIRRDLLPKPGKPLTPYQELQQDILIGVIPIDEFLRRVDEIGRKFFKNHEHDLAYPEIKDVIVLAKSLTQNTKEF